MKTGDTIKLLPDITLTEQVNILTALDGLTLDGDGHTITCATATDPLKSGGSALYFGNASEKKYCTGITIKNLTMTGTARFAIFLCGGTSSTFENVKINGNWYIGVNLYGTHGATMTDCEIINKTTGSDKYISAVWSNVASANPLTLINTKVSSIAINEYTSANKLEPKIFVGEGSAVDEIHTFDDGSVSGDKRLCVSPTSKGTYVLKEYDDANETWVDIRVAKITDADGGVTYFGTLAEAFAAAKAGDTITLVSNLTTDVTKTTADDRLLSTVDVTLDLAGHTLTIPAELEPTSNFAAIFVTGGTLTVRDSVGGGRMQSGTADVDGTYLFNVNGGHLIIESGDFFAGITVGQAQKGTITVLGGHFAASAYKGGYDYLFNCIDAAYKDGTASITIKGGTFEHYDPRYNGAEGKGTSFVAPGVGVDIDENGNFVAVSDRAAQIINADGSSVASYATLAEAIAAAKDGQTVKLLANMANIGNIVISKNLIIDGCGYIISGNSNFSVEMPENAAADLTFINLTFKDIKNGNKLSAFYCARFKGKLTLTGCTFDGIEYEALQITPAPGAVINISDNLFIARADGKQVRLVHVEMAYGTGFDYEGQNISLVFTDNRLLGTVSGDASLGVWWVGADSELMLSGNYIENADTVSVTLSKGGVRYNGAEKIYPARSQADVDVDNLMPVAIVLDKASGDSKSSAYNSLAEAIAAAKDGQTVKLLADVTENIVITKNITLDLNGKTLKGVSGTTLTIEKGATVTVKNGTVIGTTSGYTIQNNGTATFEDLTAIAGNTGSSMLANSGTLTITSGTYEGGLNTVINKSGATLTIDGGTFSTKYAENGAHTGVIYNNGNLAVNGGNFTHYATTPTWAYPHVIMTAYDKEGTTKPSTVIRGGTFISTLKGWKGTVINNDGDSAGCTKVFGGTFNMKVDESYCAEGFAPKANDNGTYGVEQLIRIEAAEGVLGENIKFYILTNRYGDLKFRIRVTLNGEEVIYDGIEYTKDGKEYYAYILDLPPQYLDTTFKIELVNNDGETIQTVEKYSFLEYCEVALKKDESAKQLIADLLWYSVAAKNKCGLDSASLVTKLGELGLVQSTGDVKATVEKSHTVSEGNEKLISGATLYHDSVNRIIVLVEKDAYAKAENHSFTYRKADGEAKALVNIGELEKDGTTYVTLATEGIYANEFDTEYTIEVSVDGAVVETLVYSVNSYCEVKAATNDLAKAIYYYGVSAKAYKH